MADLTSILNAFRILVHSIHASSRVSEQTYGLTGAQLFVLQKLSEAEQLTVNELAERTHTRQSTVSVVVSKLVKKSLVSRARSKDDARVQLLALTASGRKKLERTPNTIQERLTKAIGSLSRSEQRTLSRLLYTVLERSDLHEVPPPLFLEENTKKKPLKS